MLENLQGASVLVTGGTRGLGLACGLAFARAGARCILTYRRGGTEDEVRAQFASEGYAKPLLVRADVVIQEDTGNLVRTLCEHGQRVDVFVSSTIGVPEVASMTEITEHALLSSIRHAVWPTLNHLQEMRRVLGRFPRYTIAMSTTSIERYIRNYDLQATSKAALEALCRYMAFHMRGEDSRINVLRTHVLERGEATGRVSAPDLQMSAARAGRLGHLVKASEVADTAVAMCSGLMDDLNGQIVTVDRGGLFCDNMSRLFTERRRIRL